MPSVTREISLSEVLEKLFKGYAYPQAVVSGVPRPTFPKTLPEFQSQFSTQEACQKYLVSCRWPDGFVCPRCGNQNAYELVKLKRWQCTGCRHQVSVTAQTILHNTKIPLTVWFSSLVAGIQ
jgi:ribosomal protein L37AE/L43A